MIDTCIAYVGYCDHWIQGECHRCGKIVNCVKDPLSDPPEWCNYRYQGEDEPEKRNFIEADMSDKNKIISFDAKPIKHIWPVKKCISFDAKPIKKEREIV